jgi:hypothetical protein
VERRYWAKIFENVHRGRLESAWDYPWAASIWYRGGLTATPNVNLVSNIGFGPDATHTKAVTNRPGNPVRPVGEIIHPSTLQQDLEADKATFDGHFGGLSMRMRYTPARFAHAVKRRLRRLILHRDDELRLGRFR